MVIWEDLNILVREKVIHIKKIGGKVTRSFCISLGEVPVFRFNEITRKIEQVINNRGRAYAARRRKKYRKNKKKDY